MYWTQQHQTAPHCTTLHPTASYCITVHHTASHSLVLNSMAPQCTTLPHTALFFTSRAASGPLNWGLNSLSCSQNIIMVYVHPVSLLTNESIWQITDQHFGQHDIDSLNHSFQKSFNGPIKYWHRVFCGFQSVCDRCAHEIRQGKDSQGDSF